jgi:hypothetical protein
MSKMRILIPGMLSIDLFLKREPVLKADVQLANKYIKKCSMSLAIKENTNENHMCIPSHFSNNAYLKKKIEIQLLAMFHSKGIPLTRIKFSAVKGKQCKAFLKTQKKKKTMATKKRSALNLCLSQFGMLMKECKSTIGRLLHIYVYYCNVHDTRLMNSYLPFHRCMDKIICHIISFVRK